MLRLFFFLFGRIILIVSIPIVASIIAYFLTNPEAFLSYKDIVLHWINQNKGILLLSLGIPLGILVAIIEEQEEKKEKQELEELKQLVKEASKNPEIVDKVADKVIEKAYKKGYKKGYDKGYSKGRFSGFSRGMGSCS